MPGFEVIGRQEKKAVDEVFKDGGILFAHGFDAMRKGRYRVREFEKAFAKRVGSKYALAVSSGTAALKVALIAAGVKPGDEVITQAFTFISTVEAIMDVGAIPVIVNVDETLNMDPDLLEKAITERTKVVMPVHMLGVAAQINKIKAVAKKHELVVIDDNCESLGAKWNKQILGVQADLCAWSFDFGKVITTGEGGMVTTNNEKYYKLAKEYHDHGHENNKKFPRGKDTHRIYGFNYRMTELQAAIGMEQLKKLDFILKKNFEHYKYYEKVLSKIKKIKFRKIPKECTPLYDCLIFSFPKSAQVVKFVELINKNGLGTKNIPDAIEWHFAKYWNHIFSKFNISKKQLKELTKISAVLLEKSVAIPIMVNTKKAELKKNTEVFVRAAQKALERNEK